MPRSSSPDLPSCPHLLRDFLAMLRAERNASKNTLEAYTNDLQGFFEWLGTRTLAETSPQTLEEYFIYLTQERHLSPRSSARKRSSLKHFFKFLVSEGLLAHTPAARLPAAKQPRPLPATLSEAQMQQLLAVTEEDATPKGRRLHTLLQLCYACGLRVSELVSLRLAQVEQVEHAGTHYMVLRLRGKGGRERIVPVHAQAQACLAAYLQVRELLATDDNDYFFPSRSKQGYLTRQRVGQLLRALAPRLGIAPELLHPHALRHAFGSHVLAGGADLRVVQELLGHASIATTQIYTHVQAERLREVTKKHPLSQE